MHIFRSLTSYNSKYRIAAAVLKFWVVGFLGCFLKSGHKCMLQQNIPIFPLEIKTKKID